MFMLFLVFLFCVAVFFGSVSLRPDELSVPELTRRAKRSQQFRQRLRRQEYLPSLIVMIRMGAWVFIILFITLSAVWYGWLGGLLISMIALAVYPLCTRFSVVSNFSTKVYEKVQPYLLVAAEKAPFIWRLFHGRFFDGFGSERLFSSREELAESIEASSDLFTNDERLLLKNSLTFRDKKVREVMTPRAVIQTVGRDEFLGPLVLDELHAQGHGRLPVIDADIDHIVGVLNLRTLLSLDVRKSETAENLMESKVFYLHEDDSLQKALAQFVALQHHLFIIVNDHRETVGLLTLEDVIEALIGKNIVDEDDVHTDMRAVATEKSKQNNNSPNGIYL